MKKSSKSFFLTLFLLFLQQANLVAVEITEAVEVEKKSLLDTLKNLLPADWVREMEHSFLGVHFFEYYLCVLILLVTLLFKNLIIRIVFGQLKILALKTDFDYDDRLVECLEKPAAWLIQFTGLYFALIILPFDKIWSPVLSGLFKNITVVLGFWAILRTFDVLFDAVHDISLKKKSSFSGFVPLLKKIVRIIIFALGATVLLDHLGYSVGGIITGLGIGGAALAFASKDTIANFYGSIALAADRPFKVGDWIQVGDKLDGDVESIGLRSTRIRTFPKTVLSIPNAVLANETINNWSRMPKRRIKQVIGVTYDTSPEQMEELVEEIRKILREDEGVNQEFSLVHFTDFGASSLDIMVYYFTKTTVWTEYLDIRQRMNLKIMKAVQKHGLSIAFPSRTVYFDGEIARKMADSNDGALPDDFGSNAPA